MKFAITVLAGALALPVAAGGQRITNISDLSYHGGPVQHSQVVYTIFWNPTGTPFPTGYQQTINDFIQDLDGSAYYGILSQYGDISGTISSSVGYGGTWFDTLNPYPSSTLTQADLLAEVNRARIANGWGTGPNFYFQVYTAAGIGSSGSPDGCGTHWFGNPPIGQVTLPTGVCLPSGATPHDRIIDGAIISSARYISGAATNPAGTGWYYLEPINEVACINDFGNRMPGGANVVFNGRPYLVPRMWSNLSGGCLLGSGAQPAAPTGITLTRFDPAQLRLSWTPVSGATSYGFGISLSPGGPFTSACCYTVSELIGISRGLTYYLTMWAIGPAGVGPTSPPVTVRIPLAETPFDYDNDRHGDLTVWRPSVGYWFSLKSSTAFDPAAALNRQWGSGTEHDIPVSGDVDGDGRGDLVVWRPSTGTWLWLTSRNGYAYTLLQTKQWGAEGDVPMLGDVDGDSRADLIVWRPSTGYWYWLTSSTGYDYAAAGAKQWGNLGLGDKPLLGDVDNDQRVDLTVWRASTGTWFWLTSSTGYDYAAFGQKQWGNNAFGDKPILGDVDGDGRSDLVVWRASSGTWFWVLSSASYANASQGQQQWGSSAQNDVPMLTDLDGDDRVDLTVWRPGDGTWYWLTSASSYSYAAQRQQQWGAAGDIPMNK